MFKLPALQPHLTGSNGLDGKPGAQPSKYQPFFSTSKSQRDAGSDFIPALPASGRSQNGAVEVNDWQAQAHDLMADVRNTDKYKSVALHAEVKLAEALDRCERLSPAPAAGSGEPRPNKLRTAVCCQLLGEFAELCGPFSNVLRSIRDELVGSVYSALYSSELGTLVFDQLPWFSVAERLQQDKDTLLEERTRFTHMLHEQQEVIRRIEEQVASYQRATQAAQTEAGQLRIKLEALAAGEELARGEARTGREELKRLRKEWLRMKDELTELSETHRKLKEETDQDSGGLRMEMQLLQDELRTTQQQLLQAQEQLAYSVPAHSVSEMQHTIKALQVVNNDYRHRVESLEVTLQEAQERLGSMTPRPLWKAVHAYGIQEGGTPPRKTQELVAAAAEKLAAMAAAVHRSSAQAVELEMVCVEDPPPAAIRLTIATDASPYFITEGAGTTEAATGGQQGGTAATVSAEGLGRGPHIPRCLRRRAGHMVSGLQQLSLEATEALVMHIWKCKQVHDQLQPAQQLHAYLYTYFSRQWDSIAGSQQQQQHQQQQDEATDTGQQSAPGARHLAITQQAYTLYHALSTHSRASPTVHLFHQVLSGQLSEGVFKSQELMFSTLLATATTAAQQRGGADAGAPAENSEGQPTAMVPTPVMLEALQRVCHRLPPYKLSRLRDAYCQAVHPTAAPLQQLQELLLPLCAVTDAAAQASEAQYQAHAAAAAATEEELENEDEDATSEAAEAGATGNSQRASHASGHSRSTSLTKRASMPHARGPSPTPMLGQRTSVPPPAGGPLLRQSTLRSASSVPPAPSAGSAGSTLHGLGAPPHVSDSLGNSFVALLLQLFVEHHQEVVEPVAQVVASLHGRGAQPVMRHTAPVSTLGTQVSLSDLCGALQHAGKLGPTQAALLAVQLVLGEGLAAMLQRSCCPGGRPQSGSSAGADGGEAGQQLVLRVLGQHVAWSGMAVRKLRALHSCQLMHDGTDLPDMQAMMA